MIDSTASADFAARGVDVIIRIHTDDLLGELDRAVFSLVRQSWPLVRPIIVCQDFGLASLARLDQLLAQYDWAARGCRPAVVNVANPDGGDIRAHLLNAGVAAAAGRYLAILDADDYMYGHAYAWLMEKLGGGEPGQDDFAIAFGGIMLKKACVQVGVVYNIGRDGDAFKGKDFNDLLKENFCPIHSFLIDRSRMDSADIAFNEHLTRLEDYDFLLRTCAKYPANFAGIEKKVGVYNWKFAGNNSTITGGETVAEMTAKTKPWDEARQHIKSLKRDIVEARKRRWIPGRQKA